MSGIPPRSREIVMSTLFAILQSGLSSTFKTVDRKLKLWINVPAELQPALYMVDHTENSLPSLRGVAPKREWDVTLFIYATVPEVPGVFGSKILNDLLDAVDVAIMPSPASGVLTLGGLTYRVWVEGPVRKDPGDLDGQAVALYPIKIRPP